MYRAALWMGLDYRIVRAQRTRRFFLHVFRCDIIRRYSMVNRKSLVFALCATASIIGLAGCSDDSGSSSEKPSGNESLVVNPTSVQLSKGQELPVTVLHSAASITATSNDESCVTATVVNDSTGVSKVNIKTVATQSCATTVEIKGDSKTESVAAAVVFGAPILNVTPQTINAKVGDAKRATAEYTKDGDALADKTLTLSLSSTDCVTLASNEVTTNDQGKAHIDITAGNKACETTLTITPPDNGVKAKTVEIKVTEDGTVVDDGKGVLEFFDPKSTEKEINFTLNGGTTSKNFSVRYFNSESKDVIADAKLIFTTEGDEDCIKVSKGKTIYTNEAGIASNAVTFITKGIDGCDASVAITTENTDVDALKVKVHVDAIEDYRMKVVMNVDKSSTAAKIGYAQAAFMRGANCNELSDYSNWIQSIEALDDNFASADSIDASGKPLGEVLFNAVPVLSTEEKAAVIAYATSGAESKDIIAYGCYDLESRLEGEVSVDMTAVPINIKGEYDIISNFDISSAYTKDKHPELPAVEDMNAGDWVDWIVNLFDNPVKALYDFIWVNSIVRLGDIEGVPDWAKNFILGPATKGLVWDLFSKELLTYLNTQGWYKIIIAVAPDIKDLTTNMQFKGTMAVETTDASGLKITKATQTYNELQYRWSYNIQTNNDCLKGDVFTEPGTCRMSMPLDKAAHATATLTGDWTGKVTNGDVISTLDIDEHELTMKWATILYNAIFGEIMPKVLGYDKPASANLQKGRLTSAFLEKVLFDTVAQAYTNSIEEFNKKNACTCEMVDKDTEKCTSASNNTCRYKLKSTQSCERFIESIVYYAYAEASKYASTIQTVASLACSDKGLGQLDDLVVKSLDKVQAGKFTIATNPENPCNLFDDGASSYQRIGDITAETTVKKYNVYDVITSQVDTKRCRWNFDLTKNYTAIGLFHATRKQ